MGIVAEFAAFLKSALEQQYLAFYHRALGGPRRGPWHLAQRLNMKMMRWPRHYKRQAFVKHFLSAEMSGFEVVGVLLGRITLLISVLEHYAQGVRASRLKISATSDEFTVRIHD